MERKLKICSDCEKPSVLWRSTPKLCKPCAMKPKNKKEDKSKDELKAGLNVFFAEQALQFPVHCENCSARLNGHSMFARRKQTCHILPKRPDFGFPSVAIHPQNRVFMCCQDGCYGHEKWDNGDAADRIKMPVYAVAVERFKSFEDTLTPKELIKAYEYLNLQ